MYPIYYLSSHGPDEEGQYRETERGWATIGCRLGDKTIIKRDIITKHTIDYTNNPNFTIVTIQRPFPHIYSGRRIL